MGVLWVAMGSYALVGAITPGPVNIMALRHGASAGREVALAYVIGASVSYAGVVWLMGVGGQFVLSTPWAMHIARWAGAVYLFHLAWRVATAPVIEMDRLGRDTHGTARSFGLQSCAQGALTQVLNPKAWIVAFSGVSLFVLSQRDVPQAHWLFVSVSLLACLVGVGSWALVGGAMARWLTPPRRQRGFNGVMGCVLALCVLAMLG